MIETFHEVYGMNVDENLDYVTTKVSDFRTTWENDYTSVGFDLRDYGFYIYLRMSKDWNEVIPDDMQCGVAFNEMVYDIETFMFDRDEDVEVE